MKEAAMRLLPNIRFGTEHYPEKVARRLRDAQHRHLDPRGHPRFLCRRALFRTGTDLRPWNPHLFGDWVPGESAPSRKIPVQRILARRQRRTERLVTPSR